MGESTLTTIPGEYENGQIRLSGPAPVVSRARVLVTFLENAPDADTLSTSRRMTHALDILESTTLSEEEGEILDELEAFREKHPFDLGSLADSTE